jgi:hypothetical protein
MSYEEDEALSDSGFNPTGDENLDDDSFTDEPIEEKENYRFDEEESESL